MKTQALTYGSVIVPNTASWSGEETFSIAPCTWFSQRPAIFQNVAPGMGKPLFSKPHMLRQRQAIAQGLCDICGRALATRTKVSLSHARRQPHSATGWEVLQVEPLMHRECAAIAIAQCPSLRRDIDEKTLQVRQVFQWRVQCAVMDERYVEMIMGQQIKALGHAKVQLIKWADPGHSWLDRKAQ